MKTLIATIIAFFTLLAAACSGGESPNPVHAEAYDDGWNIGVAFIVCELADGNKCFENLYLSDGSRQGRAARSSDEGERKAYFKGHSNGQDTARECLETVIKSMSDDLWDTVEIEGVGMDFERAVTAFQVFASQSDWDAHAKCVSKDNNNPYDEQGS